MNQPLAFSLSRLQHTDIGDNCGLGLPVRARVFPNVRLADMNSDVLMRDAVASCEGGFFRAEGSAPPPSRHALRCFISPCESWEILGCGIDAVCVKEIPAPRMSSYRLHRIVFTSADVR